MRRPFIAGNWKLNKTVAEALELVNTLKNELAGIEDRDIVVAPPFTALSKVADFLVGTGIAVAAQNCFPESAGAFTGEVSPPLLADAGCRYVIVGHSERRQLFGETNEFINHKAKAVLAQDLSLILCIGETLKERESGATFNILRTQVEAGLQGLRPRDMAKVVIAYEPVWAIGTGKTASNEQAAEAHAFIRALLREMFDEAVAAATRILYGGSVKPDNIDGLMSEENIDGALVGGASLKATEFIRIVRFRPS